MAAANEEVIKFHLYANQENAAVYFGALGFKSGEVFFGTAKNNENGNSCQFKMQILHFEQPIDDPNVFHMFIGFDNIYDEFERKYGDRVYQFNSSLDWKTEDPMTMLCIGMEIYSGVYRNSEWNHFRFSSVE